MTNVGTTQDYRERGHTIRVMVATSGFLPFAHIIAARGLFVGEEDCPLCHDFVRSGSSIHNSVGFAHHPLPQMGSDARPLIAQSIERAVGRLLDDMEDQDRAERHALDSTTRLIAAIDLTTVVEDNKRLRGDGTV